MGRGRLGGRVRRMGEDVRIELTPMIDVVFLLLTFFVFSIVLMVRADVLDVRLPELSSGRNAERVNPVTIAVSGEGTVLVNGEAVGMAGVIERVLALREEFGEGPIVLAVDTRSPAGVMIELADELTGAGIGEFSIIGRREREENADERP